jgi:hypothetical protein
MNKQELIDKVVKELKGKWVDETGEENHLYRFYGGRFVTGIYSTTPSTPEYVCNKEQFQQRSRELGWINGYKWGVEYPTNGKKPDLPDDILVRRKHYNEWSRVNLQVKDLDWRDVKSFRIIDERYKPVEQRPAEAGIVSKELQDEIALAAWWDYENNKPAYDGALPPVGINVQMRRQGEDWVDGQLLFAGEQLIVVLHQETEISLRHYHIEFRPLDHATRAKELERKRVVGAALSAGITAEAQSKRDIMQRLYDKGFLCMPPKDKAETRQQLIDIIVSVGNQSEGVLADAIIAAGWECK